jgi:MtfA peptidase
MSFWNFFRRKKQHLFELTDTDRSILLDKVKFYLQLDDQSRVKFETQVENFLNTTTITGIKTTVSQEDRILIGASAIIPIFAFDEWEYKNLNEVLVYPEHFDEHFTIGSKSKYILGMVGNGFMEGTMILSKKSLHHGFNNKTDKLNTAIHEFIHLMDKSDGRIDGLIQGYNENINVIPWIELMNLKINEIQKSKSDIRDYAALNSAEFLAVTGEYFFERPRLLKKKHPKLYALLSEFFEQNPALRHSKNIKH